MALLFLSTGRTEPTPHVHNSLGAIELRLDLWPYLDAAKIEEFIQRADLPVLLTLRKASQGGKFQGTEWEREALIERFLALEPSFFDLEYDMRPEFLHRVMKKYSKTQFILSCHNCQTSADLEEVYCLMQQYPIFHYKIAAAAHSTNEALKMLLFAKKRPKTSAICMGEEGTFARVLGRVTGNLIGYASVHAGEQTAPGQLTANELIGIYNYPSLNRETAIYGLIGDPVEKSLGHLYHNAVFQERGLNAVYVKMRVKPEELSEFIPLAMAMGIRGLSVTSPLKEKILPFLDEIEPAAKQIGAVNTLLFERGRVIGTNTDGLGALDAIEQKSLVRGKRVVILGAGGAARAIAFEAGSRGADVLILNRTVQRAKEVAADMGCEASGLDEVPEDYDILINCSPNPMPIDPKRIREGKVVMDVACFPRETAFLKEASLKRCQIVYGEEMFLNQAARQTAFWIGAC